MKASSFKTKEETLACLQSLLQQGVWRAVRGFSVLYHGKEWLVGGFDFRFGCGREVWKAGAKSSTLRVWAKSLWCTNQKLPKVQFWFNYRTAVVPSLYFWITHELFVEYGRMTIYDDRQTNLRVWWMEDRSPGKKPNFFLKNPQEKKLKKSSPTDK